VIAEQWRIELFDGPPLDLEVVFDDTAGGTPWTARGQHGGCPFVADAPSREGALGAICALLGHGREAVRDVRPRVAWERREGEYHAHNGDVWLRVAPGDGAFRACVIERGLVERLDTFAALAEAKAWAERALGQQFARRAGR
jgi:hypothetical protein